MRSVSQIYSEAVLARNNYLQLSELDSGRSNSKLGIMNLLTYVAAVCIHTYEAVLDLFEVRIAEVLNGRINGTPDWYALMAKKFQYNPVAEIGDEMRFNEDTMKVEYVNPDPSHRIIDRVAWQVDAEGGYLTLKVCKANDVGDEADNGIPYRQLDDYELTAFRMFVQQIKFVGAEIYCESSPGDIVTVVADRENPVFYDDRYVTAEQALAEIRNSMTAFANDMEFNGFLYYQSVLDIIRKAEHITDVGRSVRVLVTSWNSADRKYNKPVELTGRIRLKSGYIRLTDTESVLTVNPDNITLVAASKMDDYYASLS